MGLAEKFCRKTCRATLVFALVFLIVEMCSPQHLLAQIQPSVTAVSTEVSPPQNKSGTKELLGRLFFSPQQRQELERRRELNIQESTVVLESLYTVNGHVSRNSGKTTTWVNGIAQNEAYRPRDPAVIPLRPIEEELPVDLRVGQTLDKNSGTINNGISGGEIRIKPGTAPGRR